VIGREQAAAQTRPLLKLAYRVLGDFRYPVALRAYHLRTALPADLSPQAIWDAGCGLGQNSFYLAQRYAQAQVVGTDVFESSVQHCISIATHLGLSNVQFHRQNLVDSMFVNHFDLITCFEVLEHIDDYQTALAKLAAALRPGGVLILHTPADERNFQSERFGLRKFMHQHDDRTEPGQYHARPGYTLPNLQTHLQQLGLTITVSKYTFGWLAMHAHTVYEACRSRTILKLLSYILLLPIGILDAALPKKTGGSLMIVAKKQGTSQ
jgi:2-polyprenyl-3-methyl-5-hydroxy-6-metoxy-1,4-benzoquinol methylase